MPPPHHFLASWLLLTSDTLCGRSAPAPPVDAGCQARLNAWCNCHAHCQSFPEYGEFVALRGLNRDNSTHKQWRCYPVADLTPDRQHYNKTCPSSRGPSDHICTRDHPGELPAVLRGCAKPTSPDCHPPTNNCSCGAPAPPPPSPPAPQVVVVSGAGAPVVVTAGPAEPSTWNVTNAVSGQTWFPALLQRLDSGSSDVSGSGGASRESSAGAGLAHLLLSFKADCDCSELPLDVGMNGRDFYSSDAGSSWTEMRRLGVSNGATGLVRPCFLRPANSSSGDGSGGSTVCLTRSTHSHQKVSATPDHRRGYLAAQVFSAGGRQMELFNASLSFPFPLLPSRHGGAEFTYSVGTDGNALPLPGGGGHLVTVYGEMCQRWGPLRCSASVEDGSSSSFAGIVAMRSEDGGRRWRYHGTVANGSGSEVPAQCRHPTETSMAWLGGGGSSTASSTATVVATGHQNQTILSVWRSGGTNQPLCGTTSTDAGRTFSNPRPLLGPFGVEPKLLSLSFGVTGAGHAEGGSSDGDNILVISSGRVGLWLHFCSAANWTGRWQGFNLARAHNELVADPAQHFPEAFVNGTQKTCRTPAAPCSTSYTGLAELGTSNGGDESEREIAVSYDLINAPLNHAGKSLNYIFVMKLRVRLAHGHGQQHVHVSSMPATPMN